MNILKKITRRKNKMELDTKRKQEIEEIASRKLKEFDLNTAGFDLIRFLQEKENFKIAWDNMEDDTTGFVIVNDEQDIPGTNSRKIIAINSNLLHEQFFIQRRRFIVAHEYEHTQLNKKEKKLYAHRDISKKDTCEEKEADFFASCFLMPKDLIKAQLQKEEVQKMEENRKIQYLAELFNVTIKKMKNRLLELKYND